MVNTVFVVIMRHHPPHSREKYIKVFCLFSALQVDLLVSIIRRKDEVVSLTASRIYRDPSSRS